MLNFKIITLFPQMFEGYMGESMLKRAKDQKLIDWEIINLRDFATDQHKTVDDIPYGGGPGMVIKAEPVLSAIDSLSLDIGKTLFVLFEPKAEKFTNTHAIDFTKYTNIVLICGRYEGIDSRVEEALKAEFGDIRVTLLSIGDYVLTGGELPAMVVVDAISRQVPGVLGNTYSLEELRNASPKVYTRPEKLERDGKTFSVPPVLTSGNHALIDEWRKGMKEGK